MSDKKSEANKIEVLRISNEQSNKLTRECIETAMIELLKTEEFEKISISDIVKRAGVSRMAYYRNYKSKEDILSSLINEFWNAIVKAFPPIEELSEIDVLTTVFETLQQYKEIYQVILKAHKEDQILKSLNSFTLSMHPICSNISKYNAFIISGMLYNVLTEWFRNDIEISAMELATICVDFHNRKKPPRSC